MNPPATSNLEPEPAPEPRETPQRWSSDDAALSWLLNELRSLARSQLSGERSGHTLNATALVNEVYLKLRAVESDPTSLQVADPGARARFFSLAARAMRQILVDHARARGRQKRGGTRTRVDESQINRAIDAQSSPSIDPAEIAELLERLDTQHPEAARVVELRFFAGLTEATIADLMGVTERTVRRHWAFAKAWLHRELSQPDLFTD